MQGGSDFGVVTVRLQKRALITTPPHILFSFTNQTCIRYRQGCGVGVGVGVAQSRGNEPGVGDGVDQTASTPTSERFV